MPQPGIGRLLRRKKGLWGGGGSVVREGAMTKLFFWFGLAPKWRLFPPKERTGNGILPVRLWIRWSDGSLTSEEY